jgi:hypothetical protein
MSTALTQTYMRRHIALPTDHGSWVFILSPMLIGLFAGGQFTSASLYLVIGAMAAFLIRQPVTTAIKAYSGRRSRGDLPAAVFWMILYGAIALAALVGLVLQGFAYLLLLALPGIPVFVWYLYLVSRRAERRQVGVEVVGSGVLALVAPAAYWVVVGYPNPLGWWLFLLTWFQSAASIVYAYLSLEQRQLRQIPDRPVLLRMARRALLYTSFNFVAVLILGIASVLPKLLFLPYALQWVETLYGTFNPAVGYKPTAIGIRQLVVSTLFTILFIVTWNI